MEKLTLKQLFAQRGLELLTYIDKKILTDNDVTFCVTAIEKKPVENSKFDINEQWQLTIIVPTSDDNTRKYWLTFTPNEIRDTYMLAVSDALNNSDIKTVHSCKLQAIPTSKYDNPIYAFNFSDDECACGLE